MKNFFPHPNQLLIWAYPENLVKIRLLVQALDELCRREGDGREQQGTGRESIGRSSLKLGALKA